MRALHALLGHSACILLGIMAHCGSLTAEASFPKQYMSICQMWPQLQPVLSSETSYCQCQPVLGPIWTGMHAGGQPHLAVRETCLQTHEAVRADHHILCT